jgi:hypothetical protein
MVVGFAIGCLLRRGGGHGPYPVKFVMKPAF